MWPGCTRSSGTAPLATAACTVRARSAAEMPVVTPSAASMDTVKAVPFLSPLRTVMGGNCSASQRSRDSVRQISPRPNRAMKLMASAVTWSAAKTRSPSFSRSSSSTRMTMRPARMSATMSSTEEMGTGFWGFMVSMVWQGIPAIVPDGGGHRSETSLVAAVGGAAGAS